MSEPTLYQATVEPANIGYDGDERPLILQEAIDIGALVLVGRCEHGYIDRHLVWTQLGATQGESSWCPGAGIGGDE